MAALPSISKIVDDKASDASPDPISEPSSLKSESKEFLGEEQKLNHASILRRVDTKIIIFTYVLYCVLRIDTGNISNAGVMNKEVKHSIRQVLNLTAQQWTWVVACFSYPYMVAEPISTFMVKVTTPSKWLSRIAISWGLVMIFMSLVKNYPGLIVCRVLLGLMEGGFFPSVVYHWSFWYTPRELIPRILGLYSAGAFAGAVSGFLSWALSFADKHYHPSSPLYGWQILFILEGLLPFLLGIACYFILPDYPHTSKWLTKEEADHIVAHLHRDSPKHEQKTWSWPQAIQMFQDPTYYLFTSLWILTGVGGWGISFVLPVVISDMGFVSSASSNLLNIPPAIVTIIFCISCSLLVTRRKWNPFPITAGLILLVIVGYILLITVNAPGVRYFAVVLITGANGAIYPILWPRRVEALRGTAAAALGIGLHNASAQFGGILGPQLYKTSYGPRYIRPFQAALALMAAGLVVLFGLWWVMDGNISRFPRLAAKVQSQSQFKDGDEEDRKEVGVDQF